MTEDEAWALAEQDAKRQFINEDVELVIDKNSKLVDCLCEEYEDLLGETQC